MASRTHVWSARRIASPSAIHFCHARDIAIRVEDALHLLQNEAPSRCFSRVFFSFRQLFRCHLMPRTPMIGGASGDVRASDPIPDRCAAGGTATCGGCVSPVALCALTHVNGACIALECRETWELCYSPPAHIHPPRRWSGRTDPYYVQSSDVMAVQKRKRRFDLMAMAMLRFANLVVVRPPGFHSLPA